MPASTPVAAGQTDSVLCCEVLAAKRLLASGGEDGALCLTDLATLKPVGRLDCQAYISSSSSSSDAAEAAVPALSAHPGEEHTLFAAAGPAVLQLDVRRALGPAAVVQAFQVGQEEVNGLAVTAANGGWLAAADDGGEVHIVSLQGQQGDAAAAAGPSAAASSVAAHQTGAAAARVAPARPASYKTLRRGHSNICSCAAFRPHRPWEVLSGGLDSTVVRWDFSRLRPVQSWELSAEVAASGGQLFNPPMVHSLAVPQSDDRSLSRLIAVGRGDGCISLYDADYSPSSSAATASGSSGRKGGKKGGGSSGGARKGQQRQQQQERGAAAGWSGGVPGRLASLGAEQGGHTAAVNCVSFVAASHWQQLLSAGNDCRLLLWNWQAVAAAEQEAAEAAVEAAQGGSGSQQQAGQEAAGPSDAAAGGASSSPAGDGGSREGSEQPLIAAEHKHPRKINWACSASVPGCSWDTFVADTGRRLTALALAHS